MNDMDMDMDMEEKLLKSGFTTKEIRKIKYFVKKPHNLCASSDKVKASFFRDSNSQINNDTSPYFDL